MAEEKKVEEKVEKKPTKKAKTNSFVERKLQVINAMPDGYKKTRLAERILRNKEGK